MTVHHHQVIWVDQVPKNVDGKMDTSCQIWDTQNEVSDGHRAVFKVSIIS